MFVPGYSIHTKKCATFSTRAAVEVLNEARELRNSCDVDLDQFKDITYDNVIELEGRRKTGLDKMYMAKGIVHLK